jgi:hypothetical protein
MDLKRNGEGSIERLVFFQGQAGNPLPATKLVIGQPAEEAVRELAVGWGEV